MFYLLTKFKFEGREHMEIGGEDIGSLMDVDIGTELGYLRSLRGKGKTPVDDSGGLVFREFKMLQVGSSPREDSSGG